MTRAAFSRVLYAGELLKSQHDLHTFLKGALGGRTKHSCDLTLVSKGRSGRRVSLEVQHFLGGLECRAVVVDITDR